MTSSPPNVTGKLTSKTGFTQIFLNKIQYFFHKFAKKFRFPRLELSRNRQKMDYDLDLKRLKKNGSKLTQTLGTKQLGQYSIILQTKTSFSILFPGLEN